MRITTPPTLLLSLLLLSPITVFAEKQQPLTLQLKWDNEFQFAGYYAANWQGYYAEKGLDVTTRTRVQPGNQLLNVKQEVLSGRASFGIGDGIALLKARSEGKPIVVLAALFQQNPYGFYSLKEQEITAPSDFIGKRVGLEKGSYTYALIESLLRSRDIDPSKIITGKTSSSLDSLRRDDLDILPTYIVSADWEAKQKGIAVNVLKPSDYGINYYGDVLFTRQQVIDDNPELVLDFVEASMRGWRYAMEHSDETARRISHELPRQVDIGDNEGYNLFSASYFRQLMLYPYNEPGQMNQHRWLHIQELLADIGILKDPVNFSQFIFTRQMWEQQESFRYRTFLTLCVFIIFITLFILLVRHQQLKQKSNSRLRHLQLMQGLLEATPDAMIIVQENGDIRYANREAEHLFDYPAGTLNGCSVDKLIPARFSNHHSQYRDKFTTNATKGSPAHQKRGENNSPILYARRNNGEEFPCDIRLNTLHDDEMLVLATIRDISQRLASEKEQRQLEKQLMHQQKMESIGQLTGGIAHDFNNLLAAILGYSELLELIPHKHDNEKYEKYIAEIKQAGTRGRDLVVQLLAFCREEVGAAETIYAEAIINESLELLRPMLPSSINITTDFDEQPSPFAIESLKLQQVIMNLVINARDAIDGVGQIEIHTKVSHNLEATCTACQQRVSGGFVRIRITDTGQGMSDEQQQRIFEPFFTTKKVGEGSGMGLSMVHGIIHSAGGHIRVNSQQGVGTEIELLFPLAVNDADPSPAVG